MHCNKQFPISGQETATCGGLYYSNTIKYKCMECIKTDSAKMYKLLHKIMMEHCNESVLYNEIDELLEEVRGE